jgi:assimilatory nitrate reductase electron transfer subunit
MPGSAVICRCNTVTKAGIVGAYRDGAVTVAAVAEATRATTGCGSCKGAVDGLCSWLRSSEPTPAAAVTPATAPELTPSPVSAPAATLTEGAA